MLGLPSSVRYINRQNRPKRIFIKREDGTLEDLFQIHVYDPRQAQGTSEACVVRWSDDQGSDIDRS